MLSLKQLRDVCLNGQGVDQCRYLAPDDNQWNVFHCLKLRPVEKSKIDKKVNERLADFAKNKVDPLTSGVPLGNNCAGYPVLKHIEQGYDKNP